MFKPPSSRDWLKICMPKTHYAQGISFWVAASFNFDQAVQTICPRHRYWRKNILTMTFIQAVGWLQDKPMTKHRYLSDHRWLKYTELQSQQMAQMAFSWSPSLCNNPKILSNYLIFYINCGFSLIKQRFGNASKIAFAPLLGSCKELWKSCLDLWVPLTHTQCPHFFCHIAFLLSRLRFHPADERQTPLEQHLKSVAGDDFQLRARILQHESHSLLVMKFFTAVPSFHIIVFVVFSTHTTYCNNLISILF